LVSSSVTNRWSLTGSWPTPVGSIENDVVTPVSVTAPKRVVSHMFTPAKMLISSTSESTKASRSAPDFQTIPERSGDGGLS
jgi:hypothetical protein